MEKTLYVILCGDNANTVHNSLDCAFETLVRCNVQKDNLFKIYKVKIDLENFIYPQINEKDKS
jgi:hypothetical protein